MLQLLGGSAVARALVAIANEKAALHTNVVALVKHNQPSSGASETDARPFTTRTLAKPAAPWAGTKARSAQTTNTERKLADLEQAVLDGC